MRIITLACNRCGTIVAGNVVERNRVIKCPNVGCEAVLTFNDLPSSERRHILENLSSYRME